MEKKLNLTGEVVSVSLSTKAKKQDGGEYEAWQIIFRDHENKIKDITKHVNSLKFTKGLKEGLESLAPGDRFTAVLEKKGAFNEVLSVAKGGDMAVAAPASGKVTGSNYETPTEREWNRVRIIRQSAVNYALQFLTASKKAFELADVFSVSNAIEAHVNRKEGE